MWISNRTRPQVRPDALRRMSNVYSSVRLGTLEAWRLRFDSRVIRGLDTDVTVRRSAKPADARWRSACIGARGEAQRCFRLIAWRMHSFGLLDYDFFTRLADERPLWTKHTEKAEALRILLLEMVAPPMIIHHRSYRKPAFQLADSIPLNATT